MRYILLSLKLLLYGYLAYILYILAFEYEPANSAFHPPFLLFVVDWVNLFIHEAGHLFFKLFGRFIYILGGSLMQVLLPALLAVVTWRQSRLRGIGLPLYWTGENMVNVSIYIRDAPYQRLHLIGKGLIHDWHWILNGDPDVSELLGDAAFGIGLLVCAAALGLGVWSAVAMFREAGTLEGDVAVPVRNDWL